jgi:hypothetical protein
LASGNFEMMEAGAWGIGFNAVQLKAGIGDTLFSAHRKVDANAPLPREVTEPQIRKNPVGGQIPGAIIPYEPKVSSFNPALENKFRNTMVPEALARLENMSGKYGLSERNLAISRALQAEFPGNLKLLQNQYLRQSLACSRLAN